LAYTDITISTVAMIILTHEVTAFYWTTTLNIHRLLLDIYSFRWSRTWRRWWSIALVLIHIASNFTTNDCACDST
jgi:hypothetical protein